MRIKISFDSATTEETRQMALALNKANLTGELKVGLNGPECWTGSTPDLNPNQFATVIAHLVKFHGITLAEHLLSR